jgi:hypothetical protein
MIQVQVVCTGKNSHRQVEMRRFSFGPTPMPHDYHGWRELHDHMADRLKDSYTFRCRRCGRNTEMKAATLRRALDGLSATGHETLDISQLPF